MSRGPRRCWAYASSGNTAQGHSQELGLRAGKPVFKRASESKASGGKEKEPPFIQVLDVTVSLPSTFAH